MAFERPTLRELISQMQSDAEREAGSRQLRQSNLRVLPKVFAYACHALYSFISWVTKQLFADTCEASYLERQASIQGIYRQAATAAEGTLTVTVAAGAGIPEGTVFLAEDGQTQFVTLEETKVGATTVAVRCATLGASGNRDAGQTYTLVSPLVGVQAEALGSEMVGGADAESDESLRSRLLYRLRNPPRGGTATDYVAWALEVPGVTRAWCFPKELGIGTVTVRFATDGLTDDGIPTAGMVERVADYIAEMAPVTAATTVVAPVAQIVNFTIKGLSPDTETVRMQVEAELRDLIRRECVPGKALLLSHIQQVVASASGEDDHKIVQPTADVMCASNAILVYGEVTYVD